MARRERLLRDRLGLPRGLIERVELVDRAGRKRRVLKDSSLRPGKSKRPPSAWSRRA
jgi:hypothetical protein